MKNKIVTHPGIIKNIKNDRVEVSIMVTSGCASCEIQGACSVSEVEEKSVMVKMEDPNQFKVNQSIIIEMQQSMGTWAVLLGYIFPFLVLFLSLIILTSTGMDQGMAGVLSILLMLPYYFTLYVLRKYLGTKFNYSIRT